MKKTFIIIGILLGGIVGHLPVEGGDIPAKERFPRAKISLSERFRLEIWDNAISLDKSAGQGQAYSRHRTSVGAEVFFHRNIEAALKLTDEFRYYVVPENGLRGMDEIIVDNLYVKLHLRRYIPGTLTLGRQNIMLGEGFVVMDGQPLDGSRTTYFNAARYDARLSDSTTVTAFYMIMPPFDNLLPRVHDVHKSLVEQREEGLGLYGHHRGGRFDLQAYLIKKNLIGGISARPSSQVTTLGFCGEIFRPRPFSASLEIAGQAGTYGCGDRYGLAGHAHVDYHLKKEWYIPRQITLGGIYFSGDNLRTSDREGWEPMFARWPKWTESYVYTLRREEGVAYWTNLASLYGTVRLALSDRTTLMLAFHHLMAPQYADWFTDGDERPGRTRGNLAIGRYDFQIDGHFSGHFVWEWFSPGDFYPEGSDSYSWIRAELMYRL